MKAYARKTALRCAECGHDDLARAGEAPRNKPAGAPSWSCPKCGKSVATIAVYIYIPGSGWTEETKVPQVVSSD